MTNKLVAKLSANLSIGQKDSIISSAILILKKINSFNLSNSLKIDQSEFYVPSFCSMTNQLKNCQNKIIIIIVSF